MTDPNRIPPQWPFKFLRWLIKDELLEEIEGNMYERYYDNLEKFSALKSNYLFVLDSIKLLRMPLLKLEFLQPVSFVRSLSHLRVAWRQIQKYRTYSAIKVGGFALGIAICTLITLYITHQTSYDKHYDQGHRVYRLVNQWAQSGEVGYWSNVHGPLKEILEDNIPEMEKVARIVLWTWGDAGENHIRVAGNSYNHFEKGFFYADPELLEILEVPLIYGDQKTALAAPNRMVISRSKAETYFPGENPIGKELILDDNLEEKYVIGGVMEDFPKTSHLQGDFIMTLFERKSGPGTSGWCCTNYNMYVRLTPDADKYAVEVKTGTLRNTLILDKLTEDGQSGIEEMRQYQSYFLQPISNVYLNPEEVGDDIPHGSGDLVWIFGFTAIIILFLACINFINLSIARSLTRTKEVGLRKVVGSSRGGLIAQFLVESWIYSFLAITFGLLLATILLPLFNNLSGVVLEIPWMTWWFVPSFIGISVFLGLISGIYPAIYFSGFRTIKALRGEAFGKGKSTLQSALVVFQFTATVVLIVGAIVINRQFNLVMNQELGYKKEQVIMIQGLNSLDENRRETLKNELMNLSDVKHVSLSDYIPVEGGLIQNRTFWVSAKRQEDNGHEVARWAVDENYLSTLDIKIVSGRNFNGPGDNQSVLINQRMADALQLDSPLGTRVVDMFDETYTIAGVVEDFYFQSVLGEVGALAMVLGEGRNTMLVSIGTNELGDGINAILKTWEKLTPNQAIRYTFMDRQFALQYNQLNRAKIIFILFSTLSIVIACSGLFALSIFMIEQKKKEMGVRKVLGASTIRIFVSLAMAFLKWVLLAIVFAIPLSTRFAELLLEGIINRIELDWFIFFSAGIMALLIALITVSFEAMKMALINPAKVLRDE